VFELLPARLRGLPTPDRPPCRRRDAVYVLATKSPFYNMPEPSRLDLISESAENRHHALADGIEPLLVPILLWRSFPSAHSEMHLADAARTTVSVIMFDVRYPPRALNATRLRIP
jgi:hypothetical protein